MHLGLEGDARDTVKHDVSELCNAQKGYAGRSRVRFAKSKMTSK